VVKRLLVLLVLLTCAPTQKAQLRREAEGHLGTCMHEIDWAWGLRKQCYEASEAWCRDAGLERSCGSDGLTFGQGPTWIRR
jgi:hypothetical protein